MKPPCETNVFSKEESPDTISSQEEFVLNTSVNAWKPKKFNQKAIEDPKEAIEDPKEAIEDPKEAIEDPIKDHVKDAINAEIAELEAELASYTDSWADSAEIEDIEDQIAELEEKLK